MHESYPAHKWLKGEHNPFGEPKAELQKSASVLPNYNLKISFPFILLLYDPI